MDQHVCENKDMLHCNMTASTAPIQLSLEDLLGDLQHARRSGDMSRLALLTYCEVRRWARAAGAWQAHAAAATASPRAPRRVGRTARTGVNRREMGMCMVGGRGGEGLRTG